MKLDITPIALLKSDSESEIWKIKVRISRVWQFNNNNNSGDISGLDLILVDEKGDRIQANVRGKLISKFQNEFEEGKCCILMNFKLSPNLGNFRGTAHPFKIFITWSTHVKCCEEIPNHSFRFNFISFEDLLSLTHDETVFVDVIGEIIGMHDLKEVIVRNAQTPCKLLNLELKSLGDSIINCVFWEKHAEDIYSYVQSFSGGPVVMVCSLMRINLYNGKFTIQSAKGSTKLFINSDISEINEFKERIPKNVISTTSGGSVLTLSNAKKVCTNHFPLDSRRTVSQFLSSNEEMTCSIFATICALKTEIPWYYIGCPTCFKKVNQYLNPETEEIEATKFTCDICQKIIISTVTRFQVHVKATDDTGTISLLMFDNEVIQLIHKSAYELLEQQVKFNRGSEFPPELLALDGRQFIFKIYKPSTRSSYKPTTFKVVKVCDDPSKILMFRDINMVDTIEVSPHFSNSETTSKLIDDVPFEASNNSSMCGSTEYPTTPTKKRSVTSAIDDDVIILSSKIQKSQAVAVEDGQLSSTKPKLDTKTSAKDCAKLSSTKYGRKVSANLIPKKEKE